MATYIKGHKNFYPDIKPFTPDYKFLSAAIDGRQAIYDSNWQATNNLYNRVVYSDLTNPNSVEYQKQFSDKLGPALEKISGMDLSLEQNVQSAKSAFAPFFEDDSVVYDMVWTNQYKDAVKRYNQIANSPDADVRGQVNQEVSMQKLAIDRRKFMEADRDGILNQPLPELIRDADLVKNAQRYLSELDPGLTISTQVPNMVDTGKVDKQGNPVLKQDDKFIITQTNGSLIEGAAYNQIMEALYNDPRVVKYYNAKSYVQADTTANEFVNTGMASSYEQGLEMWSTEQISRLNALNADMIGEAEYQARLAEQVNVNWTNYAATNGIVPESYEEELLNNSLSSAEQLKAQYERYINQEELSKTPDVDSSGLYNKASAMLANYNMDKDMRTAARQFSLRGFKTEVENNEYVLADYKEQLRRKTNSIEHRRKQDLQKEEYRLKGIENSKLSAIDTALGMSSDGAQNTFYVNKDGELIDTISMKLDAEEQRKDLNILQTEGLDLFPELFAADSNLVNPFMTDVPGEYKVPLVTNPETGEVEEFVIGNQEQVLKRLSSTKKDDGGADTGEYEYEDAINNVFGQFKEAYYNTNTYVSDPDLVDSQMFTDNYDKLWGIRGEGQQDGLALRMERYIQNTNQAEQDLLDKYRTIDEAIDATKPDAARKGDLSPGGRKGALGSAIGTIFGGPIGPMLGFAIGEYPAVKKFFFGQEDGSASDELVNVATLNEAGYPKPSLDESRDEYYERVEDAVIEGKVEMGRQDLYGFANNTNIVEGTPSFLQKAIGFNLLKLNQMNPFIDDEKRNENTIGLLEDYVAVPTTNDGTRIDDDILKNRTNMIYDYYTTATNELLNNTPSYTYVNNRSGITNRKGTNLITSPTSNIVTNLIAEPGTAEDVFVGLALTQIKNTSKGGGFLGYTIGDAETDDIAALVNNSALKFNDVGSQASKFIFDTMLTERASQGDKNKISLKVKFYNTWGPVPFDMPGDDETAGPLAAYELSNFSSAFEKLVNEKAENDGGVYEDLQEEVKRQLRTGFTFVFPRDKTLKTNPQSFTNITQQSEIGRLVNSTVNKVYVLPTQFPSGLRPYKNGKPRGSGKFTFKLDNKNNLYYRSDFFSYESDTKKFPQGFSVQSTGFTQIKGDKDIFYNQVLAALELKSKENKNKRDAFQKQAKANNQ